MSAENGAGGDQYRFVLYVDSESPKSMLVADRLRQLCHQTLIDSYTVEVVDLRKDPSLFDRLRIIAAPTLDVTTPQSKTHRFVGDLSQSEMFIVALGMAQEADRMCRQAGKMGRDAVDMRVSIKSS